MRPRDSGVADAQTAHHFFARVFDGIGFQYAKIGAGLHGLGPGLNNVELACHTVARPLHVHRLTIVILDGFCLPGEFKDLRVA